jgi:hypothetical protein
MQLAVEAARLSEALSLQILHLAKTWPFVNRQHLLVI